MTVPILPTLLPSSASSESFPITPPDSESLPYETDYRFYARNSFADISQAGKQSRRPRHAGTRISTPPRSAELTDHYPRRRSLAHIA